MKTGGFTLVSLMIVVAIIAILASIAVPSYMQHVKRARRTEAITALQTMAYREEGYFSRHNKYTDDLTELGYGAGNPPSVDTKQGYYSVSVSVSGTGDNEFEAKAAPQNAQSSDDCGTFKLDHLGRKTTTTGSDCWP